MQVIVNGEPREVPEPATVESLLAALDLGGRYVAVEVNEEVVPRAEHAQHQLREGDRLEVVSLVGGG